MIGFSLAWSRALAAEQRLATAPADPNRVNAVVDAWESVVARRDFPKASVVNQEGALAQAAMAHLRTLDLGAGRPSLDRAVTLIAAAESVNVAEHQPAVWAVRALVAFAVSQASGSEHSVRRALDAFQEAFAHLQGPGAAGPEMAAMLMVPFARANTSWGALKRSEEHFDIAIATLTELASQSGDGSLQVSLELVTAHLQRYLAIGEGRDLDAAITIAARIVESTTPDTDVNIAAAYSLADSLRMRFATSGEVKDLDRAVQLLQGAIASVAETAPSAAPLLGALAAALGDRYRQSHVRSDAEGAVRASGAALELFPGDEPSSQGRVLLTVRAGSLLCLYEQTRERNLLDEAIDASLAAMASPPVAVPMGNDPRVSLIEALTSRFDLTGDPADISDAEKASRELLDALDERDPLRPVALRNLAMVIRVRTGTITGSADDAEDAVGLAQDAFDHSPLWDRPAVAIELALALRTRYMFTGDLNELDRVIELLVQSRDAASSADVRQMALAALCEAYALRHVRSADRADIDSAVAAGEAALSEEGLPEHRGVTAALVAGALGQRRLAIEEAGGEKGVGIDREVELREQALTLAGEASPFRPALLFALGQLLLDRGYERQDEGEFGRGEAMVNEALDDSAPSPERDLILQRLAPLEWGHYRNGAGEHHARRALEMWEESLASVNFVSAQSPLAYRLGRQFRNTWASELLVEALVELATLKPANRFQFLRRALEAAEGAKSRLLSEILGYEVVSAPPGVDPDLIERERSLASEIAALDKRDLAATGLLDALQGRPRDDGGVRRQRLRELTAVWDEIARFGAEGTAYVEQRKRRPPRWSELAALASELGEETAVLSLFLAREKTYLFVTRSGWSAPEVVAADIGQEGWERIGSRLLREVHRYDGTDRRGQTWHRDLEPLLKAATAHLEGVQRVVLAPQGVGHLIPWAVVAHLAGWAGRAGDLPIVTAPSLPAIAGILHRNPIAEGGELVAGNPLGDLQFAEREAKSVAELAGVTPILGQGANCTRIRSEIRKSSMVHLATHATFTPGSPLDSGIVLADGVLTARELIESRLCADLVVLSACETGMSEGLGGDEIAGLAQAFMLAGARSLVVSLWKVDDAGSAALMVDFHQRLRAGADRSAALAAAAAATRGGPGWSHPYYWGAFTFSGAWDPSSPSQS